MGGWTRAEACDERSGEGGRRKAAAAQEEKEEEEWRRTLGRSPVEVCFQRNEVSGRAAEMWEGCGVDGVDGRQQRQRECARSRHSVHFTVGSVYETGSDNWLKRGEKSDV